jgi:hypothetical protein
LRGKDASERQSQRWDVLLRSHRKTFMRSTVSARLCDAQASPRALYLPFALLLQHPRSTLDPL